MLTKKQTVNSYWKSIFVKVNKIFCYVTLAGTIIGALSAGLAGVFGYLLGAFIVHIWFSIDLFIAERAEKRSMTDVARKLMLTYVVKVFLGAIILVAVPLPAIALNEWMLGAAVVSVIIWLCVSMKTIMNLRILYFDEHDSTLR